MLDDRGRATPEFRDAVDRGVLLDIGHSGTDFRFRDARKLFDQGFLPDTISTDLNVFNVDGPGVTLPRRMTKVWHLGVDLADVIAMATTVHGQPMRPPGRARARSDAGAGRRDVGAGRSTRASSPSPTGGRSVAASRRLRAVGCVRAGTWSPATAGRQPELVGAGASA